MQTTTRTSLTCIVIVLLAGTLRAQSPKASIQDAAWLAGHWQGQALGGTCDEHWGKPMGRAMMGMFRLLKEDKVVFYEFFRIAEENGSLVLRLKHFHSDLKGWEEKDAMVNLPLLKITPEEIVFDGMTFRKMGPDAVTVSVMIGGKSDKGYEVKFVYSRVKDAAEAAQFCGASAWCAIAMSDAATSVVSVPAVAALSAANSSR